jgi:hypothetical protein
MLGAEKSAQLQFYLLEPPGSLAKTHRENAEERDDESSVRRQLNQRRRGARHPVTAV